MRKEIIGSMFGNAFSILGVTLTQEELASAEHITAIICMIVGLLITIICSIVIPLIKWWKNAKADGKISKDEIDEAIQIIEDGTKQINDIKEKGENKK